MNPRFYDAHNHWQDERLAAFQADIGPVMDREHIAAAVVNGSSETDWPDVLALARRHPRLVPAFGCHPWYVKEQSVRWKDTLREHLDRVPSVVGEIGLDHRLRDYDGPAQEEAFIWQLRLAAERNLPAGIHCLQAWGRLLDILKAEPRPACGFMLHAFGGPKELVAPLAGLGAYFSMPGSFAHERKTRQRETFRHVPPDRLLIETDAPDLPPPERWIRVAAPDAAGKPVHHPGNLGAVYQFAAEWLDEPLETLAARVENNFRRLFGRVMPPVGLPDSAAV